MQNRKTLTFWKCKWNHGEYVNLKKNEEKESWPATTVWSLGIEEDWIDGYGGTDELADLQGDANMGFVRFFYFFLNIIYSLSFIPFHMFLDWVATCEPSLERQIYLCRMTHWGTGIGGGGNRFNSIYVFIWSFNQFNFMIKFDSIQFNSKYFKFNLFFHIFIRHLITHKSCNRY